MQLNKFKAVARGRNAYQAIDLGLIMARAWYLKLVTLWLCVAAVPSALIFYFLYDYPFLVLFVIWWLKPFWEQPLLYVASRQLFGEQVGVKHTLMSYFKIVKFDLFWWLTFRRLSFSRSFDLPLSVLEKIDGKRRSTRSSLLHRRFSNAAIWLSIIGSAIEWFLVGGIGLGIQFFIPEEFNLKWSSWVTNQDKALDHFDTVIWFFCAALIAPIYVCSGFALYLQRRIDLEGWDIEIRFRHLAERVRILREKMNTRGTDAPLWAAWTCATLIALASFGSPPTAAQSPEHKQEILTSPAQNSVQAEDRTREVSTSQVDASKVLESPDLSDSKSRSQSPALKQAKQDVREILKTRVFRDIQEQSGYRFKKTEEKEKQPYPEWLINLVEWLGNLGKAFSFIGDALVFIAKFIEVILWGIVVALLAYFIYYFRHHIRRFAQGLSDTQHEEIEAPTVLFGLEVTKESLPDNPVDSARKAWEEGDQREALSLLLRSSIVKLMDRDVVFADGNTERECARIVMRSQDEKTSHYFSQLVKVWQDLAYAHRPCTQENFDSLCRGWREVFTDE